MTALWHTGDSLTVLRTLPDNSVDLVLTSPPFLALRSYLPDDDPAKALELGSEPTPGEFIDALLDITEELRRVLAPHGSICVELGDTYSGTAMRGQRYDNWSGSVDSYAGRGASKSGCGWPEEKSLTLIPELYRMALAYGINPLTGRTTPRWRIRNVIRWVRPNPPVGALGDKFRPGTSEMVVATGIDEAGRTRYFDLDAVRTPPSVLTRDVRLGAKRRTTMNGGEMGDYTVEMSAAGAPPLDWLEIPTKGYAGSHYATFPPALCERPIKAMCPTKVCKVCGEPSRRITSEPEYVQTRNGGRVVNHYDGTRRADQANAWEVEGGNPGHVVRTVETLGWTDCGHNAWRTGVVLDPFGGSGTTAMVATGHGRDAISIDLDSRNVDLARERIGPMFFEHVNLMRSST